MASEDSFVSYVLEQIGPLESLQCKKMFGEHAIYLEGKIVALICDNRLFVKPSKGGQEIIGDVPMDSPYPGAKACYCIEEQLENSELLVSLLKVTAQELPAPKKRAKKKSGSNPG